LIARSYYVWQAYATGHQDDRWAVGECAAASTRRKIDKAKNRQGEKSQQRPFRMAFGFMLRRSDGSADTIV
jgi:hypothetical protein